MSIRSHVDPCLFIVVMHIKGEQLESNLVEYLNSTELSDGDQARTLLDLINSRSRQVLFHESYHYWQGLRLPFLYRNALGAFRDVNIAFKKLSQSSADFLSWKCVMPAHDRLNLKYRLGIEDDDNIKMYEEQGELPPSVQYECSISPLDILECAASIAEFQVANKGNNLADPILWKRWSKRNPSYQIPLEFAFHYLGNISISLRLILPLINTAFHTTDPVRAYADLLVIVKLYLEKRSEFMQKFLRQNEPCRWTDFFKMCIEEIEFEASPDSCGSLHNADYYRLYLDSWANGLHSEKNEENKINHPFLDCNSLKWSKYEKENSVYSWAMDLPGYMPGSVFNKLVNEFSPSLIMYRFHLGKGSDKVILQGEKDFSSFTSLYDINDPQGRGIIVDMITMYSAIRRASGIYFDTYQRSCHHEKCPYFESNYCNLYPIIPSRYQECGFRERMLRLINTFRR